jgi:hypothetical protein
MENLRGSGADDAGITAENPGQNLFFNRGGKAFGIISDNSEEYDMEKLKLWVCYAAVLALVALPGKAHSVATISYPDFASLSAFTLNGNALDVGNPVLANGRWVLRLTPSSPDQTSSAYLTQSLPLSQCLSFSSFFSFQITLPSSDGADGLTFAIQSQGPTALGVAGYGLGFQGVYQSLAVEFDTFDNGSGTDQNDGNHVGIDLDGDVTAVIQYNVSTSMKNGAVWYAWVDYDGVKKSLEVRISETSTRPVAPQLSRTVNLAQILGPNAWVGFTAATGGEYQIHDILSWNFSYTLPGMSTPAINSVILWD